MEISGGPIAGLGGAPAERSEGTGSGSQNVFASGRSCRFGQAEVDDACHGLAVNFDDKDVGGLQVPVNDCFLVRVLRAVADL